MPDWGLANGPDDHRSHAEMLMETCIKKDKNPHQPCECGGTYEQQSDTGVMNIESLQKFVCDSCEKYTYEWKQKHKDRQKPKFKWD